MEEIAINIIKDGGMVAVLFVLWLVSFGWAYLKIRELQRRMEDGDSRFTGMDAELKGINKGLTSLNTKVDMMLRFSGHTPEERPL